MGRRVSPPLSKLALAASRSRDKSLPWPAKASPAERAPSSLRSFSSYVVGAKGDEYKGEHETSNNDPEACWPENVVGRDQDRYLSPGFESILK